MPTNETIIFGWFRSNYSTLTVSMQNVTRFLLLRNKVYSTQSTNNCIGCTRKASFQYWFLSFPWILYRYLMDPVFITIPLEHFVVLCGPIHCEVLLAPSPCSFSQTQWSEGKAFLWNGLLSRTLDHHPLFNQVRQNIENYILYTYTYLVQ